MKKEQRDTFKPLGDLGQQRPEQSSNSVGHLAATTGLKDISEALPSAPLSTGGGPGIKKAENSWISRLAACGCSLRRKACFGWHSSDLSNQPRAHRYQHIESNVACNAMSGPAQLQGTAPLPTAPSNNGGPSTTLYALDLELPLRSTSSVPGSRSFLRSWPLCITRFLPSWTSVRPSCSPYYVKKGRKPNPFSQDGLSTRPGLSSGRMLNRTYSSDEESDEEPNGGRRIPRARERTPIPTMTHEELMAQSDDERTYRIIVVVGIVLWFVIFGGLLT